MRSRTTLLLSLCAALTASTTVLHAQGNKLQGPPQADQARASMASNQRQQTFVENRGQWPSQVKLLSHSEGVDMWVTNSSVVYDLYRTDVGSAAKAKRTAAATETHRVGHVVRMQFIGSSNETSARGYSQKPGYFNYIYGNRSITNVPVYEQARIEKLYKGVDAVLYYDNGRPRYDLVLEPGASASAITIKYDGAKGVRLTKQGELAIATSIGEVNQSGLFAYQMVDGQRKQIACAFNVKKDGTVGFNVGAYDASKPLVIDPVLSTLSYSSFLGSTGRDIIEDMAIDAMNSMYVTGTCSTAVFPTTPGAYDVTQNGGMDVFVSKLDSTGHNLLYSTIIGGSGDDEATSIALAADGSAVIAGRTFSTDFPTSLNGYDRTLTTGTRDAFVAKLNPMGNGLVYGSYFGGNNYDGASDVAVGPAGEIYIAGVTASSNLPTSAGAYDATYNNAQDGFVAKFAADGSLGYATYLGGSENDGVNAIAIDRNGSAYVTGSTLSSNFPTSATAYNRVYANNGDVFVAKLTPTGGALLYSTYLGGSDYETSYSIVLDAGLNAYVAGSTSSSNFPTSEGAHDRQYNGGGDAFITRLNAGGSSISYSTYVGGSSGDEGYDITLDEMNNIYIAGYTSSTDFPTTTDAYDRTNNGNGDVFISKIRVGEMPLAYSTVIGGSGDEWANAIAMNDSDNIYIAGGTSSSGYPTTSGSYDQTHNGSYDGFMTHLQIRRLDLTEFMRRVRWCPNVVNPITFTSSNVDNIDVFLSSDGGLTYPTMLVGGTPAEPGVYPWYTTVSPGTNYRIKIADRDNPQLQDVGDSLFTVVQRQSFQNTLPISRTVCARDTVSFRIRVNGTGVRYQWKRNGNPILGATDSVYFIYAAQISDTGFYRVVITDTCGNIDSTDITGPGSRLNVTASANITEQPANQIACPNGTASFSVTATGVGLQYQWRKNGVDIAGATNPTYTIPTVSQSDIGIYSVVIVGGQCNSAIGVESNQVTLRISTDSVTIVRSPASQDKCTGQSVTFSAAASGSGLTYQWYQNGFAIDDATSASYTIDSVEMDDAGSYTVKINGQCPGGGKETQAAVLTVYESPTIVVQPVKQLIVKKGDPFTLSVTATGTALTYQWRRHGVQIVGATESTYQISAASAFGLDDADQYDVQITGQCGQVITSQLATVIVDTSTSSVPVIAGAQSARLSFMPNPTSGRTTLAINPPLRSFEAAGVEVALYNVLGQKVMDLTDGLSMSFNTVEFDASSLPAGLYYCRISNPTWSGMSNVVMITK